MKKAITMMLLLSILAPAVWAAAGTTDLQRMEIMQINPAAHELDKEQKITVYLYRNSTEITADIQLNVTLPNGTERKIGTNRHKLSSVAYSNASSWRNSIFTVENTTLSQNGIYIFKAENINDPETKTATFNYTVNADNDTMELALLLGLLIPGGLFFYLGLNIRKPEEEGRGEVSQASKWKGVFRQFFIMLGIFFVTGGVFAGGFLARQSSSFQSFATTYDGFLTAMMGLIIFLVVVLVLWFVNYGMKKGTQVDSTVEESPI